VIPRPSASEPAPRRRAGGASRNGVTHLVGLVALLAGLAAAAALAQTAIPAPAAAADGVALDPARFEIEAQALRRHDCTAALSRLKTRADTATADGAAARLLLGFYARTCKDLPLAQTWLGRSAQPGGPLEDWRLALLAQTSTERGHLAAAQAAWASLLGDYPQSPLRAQALLRAAQVAVQAGDARRALELVALGRREAVPTEVAAGLEVAALEAARKSGDLAAGREAARRLLVLSPLEAARTQAADLLRGPAGAAGWSALLTRDERSRRVDALLAEDIPDGALQTLDAAPAAERDVRWQVQRAEALIDLRRGAEARRALAAVVPQGPGETAATAWAQARAIDEMLAPRRGRRPPAANDRKALLAERRDLLRRVAALDVPGGPAIAALHELLPDLAADGDRAALLAAARRLHDLDPTDDAPAKPLWDRGWQAYRAADPRAAMEIWTVLLDLYPESRSARSAQYWTARAHEALGESAAARAGYAAVAASDTVDFYRRHAELRLGAGRGAAPHAAPGDPPPARDSWPSDPKLGRARLLSDLGLDDLALTELAAVEPTADPHAGLALEALVQARRGQPREAIRLLRLAFPALGGARQGHVPEEALRLYYPLAYSDRVQSVAKLQGLPPELVFAIVHQESGFDADAVSRSGARGLMQLMSSTGRELARRLRMPYSLKRLTDPEFSLRLGTLYFRDVLEMFDGNLELALAGYNAGPFRIKRLWSQTGRADELDTFLEDLHPEETRVYVKRILICADSYRRLYPAID